MNFFRHIIKWPESTPGQFPDSRKKKLKFHSLWTVPKNLVNESGGHRIQRIPPTEKRYRVHTSTVTVSVIPVSDKNLNTTQISDSDIRLEFFSGTGKGGQHRNKHQCCVRAIHIPSNITATRQGRERNANIKHAIADLKEKISSNQKSQQSYDNFRLKKNLMDSGERGDKIRTYRFQDDICKDHRSNKTCSVSKIMSGYFNLLW